MTKATRIVSIGHERLFSCEVADLNKKSHRFHYLCFHVFDLSLSCQLKSDPFQNQTQLKQVFLKSLYAPTLKTAFAGTLFFKDFFLSINNKDFQDRF